MKAVIPAAGLGTRFLPYTKAQPKEMLPVLDKPAIQYVVEEAVDSNIKDISIVIGRGKKAIENHFDRSVELESYLRKRGKHKELAHMRKVGELANIMYIKQKEPLGLGHAISCTEQYIGNEPFAVLLGDDICIDGLPCTKQLVEVFKRKRATVLAVQEVPTSKIRRYGIVTGTLIEDDLFKVDDIVEKPSPDEVKSNLATIGRYVFMPEIFTRLRSAKQDVGGEIQLTDSIRHLLKNEEVYAYLFRGRRYDIGDKISWLRANIEMAMEKEEYKDEFIELFRKDY